MRDRSVTLDRFGRIVIPKTVRNDLGLAPGSALVLEEVEEGILLKPLNEEPEVIEHNGVLVFTGVAEGDLSEAVEKDRDARLRSLSAGRRKRR
jgi:AbrB family looped-hinge helix DNA binding protein